MGNLAHFFPFVSVMFLNEMKTNKNSFFKKNIEVFRSNNGDIPIIHIENALMLAIQRYDNKEVAMDFLVALCDDLYWELADNLEFDQTLYRFVEYLMEVKETKRDLSGARKEIVAMREYLKNKNEPRHVE